MKLNPAHAIFDGNMFVQLRAILDPIPAHPSLPLLDMSIGEPQMPPCQLLLDSVARHSAGWQFYPKSNWQCAVLQLRFSIILTGAGPDASQLVDDSQIIPVPGTREPLHLLGQLVAGTKTDAVALVTNPFYHAWRAGALASGADIQFLNSEANHNFLPDLTAIDDDVLPAPPFCIYAARPIHMASVMDLALSENGSKIGTPA